MGLIHRHFVSTFLRSRYELQILATKGFFIVDHRSMDFQLIYVSTSTVFWLAAGYNPRPYALLGSGIAQFAPGRSDIHSHFTLSSRTQFGSDLGHVLAPDLYANIPMHMPVCSQALKVRPKILQSILPFIIYIIYPKCNAIN